MSITMGEIGSVEASNSGSSRFSSSCGRTSFFGVNVEGNIDVGSSEVGCSGCGCLPSNCAYSIIWAGPASFICVIPNSDDCSTFLAIAGFSLLAMSFELAI